MQGARFIAGDPLRAIAALLVVVFHTAFFAATPRPTNADLRRWYGDVAGIPISALDTGLFIFFVLSGYLIAGPFVRAFVHGSAMPRIGDYLRNRALRIVPAFWAVATIALALHAGAGSSPREIAAFYLFAQAYDFSDAADLVGPAWTLHTELTFYLAVPLCALVLARVAGSRLGTPGRARLVVVLCMTLAAASLALSTISIENEGTHTLGYGWRTSLAPMLWAFVPGILLVVAETAGISARRPHHPGRVAVAMLAAGLVLLLLYAVVVDLKEFPPRVGVLARCLLAAGSGLLVAAPLALQWWEGRCWRWLDNPVMHWLGERSYGIYLVHQAILLELVTWSVLADHPRQRFLVLLAVTLALVIPAATLLHRFVERPFLNLRHRWRRDEPAAVGIAG